MRGRSDILSLLIALCVQASAMATFAAEPAVATPVQTESPDLASSEPADATAQQPATSELSAEPRDAAQPIAPDMPDSVWLEQAGARIGQVEIQIDNIFDPTHPKERSWPYRLANTLHIKSRDQTIRAQLLFKPGDVYSRRELDETARNLRGRRYLNQASAVPVRYHPEDNTVDVLVRVRDTWTLNVGASYGRSGGANHTGFQLEEGNLLGFGKDLSIERDSDVERSVWTFGYTDPNLFGSRWELDTMYASASDGGTRAFKIDHPFFSLDTRWYAELDGVSRKQTDRIYDATAVVNQYQTEHELYGFGLGWSTGLRDGWVHRVSAGYTSDRYHYLADADFAASVPPDDQHLAYPWLQYGLLEDRYEVERNRDQVGRTEDVYYGRSLSLRIGDAAPAFGADRKALLFQIKARDAWHLSARQSLFLGLSIVGRREGGDWQGTLISTALRYDFRRSWKNLFTASLTSDYGRNLDASQVLYLGGDSSDDVNSATSDIINSSGLRGYPLHYRSGTRRNILTLEQRIYTDWQILQLLTVGGAAFVDIGQISGGDPALSTGSSVLSDIGVGLRFGNIRSSRGEVFHIEVAYPLNATPGTSKLQFLVVTKHSF